MTARWGWLPRMPHARSVCDDLVGQTIAFCRLSGFRLGEKRQTTKGDGLSHWRIGTLVCALALVLSAQTPPAKKTPAPPPPPLEPPAEVLTSIYPAGGQRGHTVEITVTGTGLAPQEILVTGGGVTGRVLETKSATQARVAVTIAADAAPGEREFRLRNAGGVSGRARFIVGTLPEINEVEPNSTKPQAQKLASLPVVINGQILQSDRDYFQFHAHAGETLVCAVEARSLLPFIADAVPGWFDPVLAIYDSEGKQIRYADDFGFKPDPVLFFRPPQDGDYIIELRDIVFRGRADFVYRLTLGAVPYVTGIFPLGGQRGSQVDVELRGVNLAARTARIAVPFEGPRVMHITANAIPLAPSDLPAIRADVPNHTPQQAQRVAAPAAIDGRIAKPGDSDYYVFRAEKGQKLLLEVQARRLDSPLDSILTLYNEKREVVAENDDWTDPLESQLTHHADSHLVYTVPAAGDYSLRLRDIQGKGGEEYAYRLLIAPPKPDFALRITPDNPRLGQGDTAAITVTALRRDEFAGDIALSVEDLPPGYASSEGLIPAGQTEGRLTITAPPDATPGILSPTIVGTATVGKESVRRRAESAESMMQAFAYTHYLATERLLMAVTPSAAFTISAQVPPREVLEVKPGGETPIVIHVRRKPGAANAVTIVAVRLANNTITTKSIQVTPDKDEVTIAVAATKDAKPGLRQDIIVSAFMRAGSQTITRFTQAIPVKVAQ